MSTALLSPGSVVDGKLTIGAATWARAGAQSYAATDEHGQAIVVTAYSPACFSSGLVLERSLRELRQLQSLQSARVAAVLGCGKLSDGGIYEANAALPGERLDAIVARGPLPGPEAATIIEQVGEGLLEAQKAGVIHRNLGPRVVFVGPSGAVVTGFSVGEPHGDKSFGPLDTIAPEQVEGKVVDQRTLIYNLAALMHVLITGAPLYPGDAAVQLPLHLAGEIPDDAHARLRRALVKDPRMRPMMLKQFLSELRAIGGGVARAPLAPSSSGQAPPLPGSNLATGAGAAKPAGAPSSRGWTMFMQGEGGAPAAGGAATAAAAAPASDVPAKPKTRGWTMFMEGADEAKKPEDKPAAKPSTRGWTMFMEDDEGQAPPPAESESPLDTPAPAVAATSDAAPPKTRGWTMFMEDEGEQAPATPSPTPAAAAPAPAPSMAPAVGGPAAKPSTRGWTMFMKADEESAAEAVALADPSAAGGTQLFAPGAPLPPPAASPAPPVAAQPVAASPAAATPKSRGWTMFTEASDDEEAEQPTLAVQVPKAPAVEAAPPPAEAAPEPAASSTNGGRPRRGDADAPSKKRGWTMFMEKPLEAKGSDAPLGGVVPASGESNAKGWTVFSPAADVHADASPEPAKLEEPIVEARGLEPSGPRPVAPAREATPPSLAAALGSTSGQTSVASDDAGARAQAAADSERLRAKTLVVTGPPEAPASARPMTMVTPPGSSPAVQPRTVTMVTPEPPAGAVAEPVATGVSGPLSTGLSGPISTGISGPISTGLSGPVSTGMPPRHVTGSHAMVPAKKGSPVVLIVVGVAIVAAVVVGAIVTFT